LEVGELDLIGLVEVHQLEEPIKPSLLDFLFLNSEDALESPLEVILEDEAIEVTVEALEALFNSDLLSDDPVFDLLDD
jgi:hypothetical protein